jgi:type I restriction enzyme S subunit
MKTSVHDLLEKHFETAFAAPDGIAKLRELILTLAMRGKLVEQDPNDPPASELLKEIEVEKQRLVKEGKIKKPKPLPPIKPEEVPYQLPQGWEWVRLGDVGLVGSSSRVHQRDWKDQGVPFYRAREIVKLSKLGFVDNELYISEDHYQALAKDGLVPEVNDVMLTGVGTIGVPYIVKETDRFYFKDASVLIFKNYYRLYAPYLYWFFKSPYWIDRIHDGSMGTTVHTLTIGRANDIVVPLPPLPEQRRIVKRIDQLMARCDELEKLRKAREEKRLAVHTAAIKQLLEAKDGTAWDFIQQHFGELYTVKENVAELRKAILQLAVMGRLVPQDPNDPPASELLKEIEAEKQRLIKEGKIKKPKPLPPIKPEEVPYQLPQGWEWVRLGDVGLVGSSSRVHQRDWKDQGVPFYRAREIVKLSKLGFVDNELYISEDHYQALAKDGLVPEVNDVMLTGVGTIGVPYIVKETDRFYFKDASVLIFKNYYRLYAPYLYWFFKSPYWIDRIHDGSMGTTVHTLTIGRANDIVVPLPPLPEQHRIVEHIDQLMDLCDRLEQQIDAATGKQTELLNAVMVQV